MAGPARSLAHSPGQIQRASSSLGPVVARHGVRGSALFGEPTHQVNLCLRVGPDGSPGENIVTGNFKKQIGVTFCEISAGQRGERKVQELHLT